MHQIDREMFIKLSSNLKAFVTPEEGVYAELNKPSPFLNHPIDVSEEDEYDFYYSNSVNGDVLYMIKNGNITFIGFLL